MKIKFSLITFFGILIFSINSLYSQTQNAKNTKNSIPISQKLVYGPKSKAKIKSLFIDKNGKYNLPATINPRNELAKYTGFEKIEGVGNIYTWDFTNGFQLSVITDFSGTISLINLNHGNITPIDVGNSIFLNLSTLNDIKNKYSELKSFKKEELKAYKLKSGNFYTTFYFSKDNILNSFSISNYDLEL